MLSTGYFCAERAEVDASGVYAVVGCGPVGLAAVAAARQRGAERLVAVDSVPERLEMARALGASTVNHLDSAAFEQCVDTPGETVDNRTGPVP